MKYNLRAGILEKETTSGSDQKGLKEMIIRCIGEFKLDIFLGPEYLFMERTDYDLGKGDTSKIFSEQDKENIYDFFAEKSKSLDSLIIPGTVMWQDDFYLYNTAPIIWKGDIKENHKRMEWVEGDIMLARMRNCNKRFKPIPFEEERGIFEWRDFNIGLEICADAGLLFYKTIEGLAKPTDIYLLTAAGMTLRRYLSAPPLEDKEKRKFYRYEMPIKKGGIGLCSNGNYEYSTEAYRNKIKLPIQNRITRKGKEKKHGSLVIYEL